jgi:UDP-N-acetylmuramyl pentapeptide phosphotransferase/UDP-N-acetylglucosamine-1-phosphate transferase
MKEIVLSAISALAIGLLLIPEIIKIAHARNMHDLPNERKLHTEKIPTFGGIGIFFGFIISAVFWSFFFAEGVEGQFLLGGILVIVIVGMRDDFLPLSAFWKLIGQIVAASITIVGGFHFQSLYGLFQVYQINDLLSYTITLYTIIVITNAFNLIDGIDGLAGSISVLVFSLFGFWFFGVGNMLFTIACFSLVGAVLAFLRYNLSPAKIFMGDTGSLLLGFMAAVATIKFLQTNAALPTGAAFKFERPISMVAALLVYPLLDTLRVFLMRVAVGRSPLSPDKNHIHHLLLRLGLSHGKAVLIILSFNIVFILVFYWLNKQPINDNFLVLGLVITALAVAQALRFWVKRREE